MITTTAGGGTAAGIAVLARSDRDLSAAPQPKSSCHPSHTAVVIRG